MRISDWSSDVCSSDLAIGHRLDLPVDAEDCGAPLFRYGVDWQVETMPDGSLLWHDRNASLRLPAPALLGAHQVVNAATAVACARQLQGFALPADTIAAGLRDVDWPARMQRLTRGPLVDALPPGPEVWLDGAHTALAGAPLAGPHRRQPQQ